MIRRALLVAIFITLLLMVYTAVSMIEADDYIPYEVEVLPWSGSYTAVVELPYVENSEFVVKEKLDNVKSTELSSEKYIGLRSMTEGGD